MILEIVSPEATLLHTDVDLVSVPGINGEFQMLNNHAPIVSLLGKGNVKINAQNMNIEKEFVSKFNLSYISKNLPTCISTAVCFPYLARCP